MSQASPARAAQRSPGQPRAVQIDAGSVDAIVKAAEGCGLIVTITGSAPGMASVIAKEACELLGHVDTISIIVYVHGD
ncbi:MAG: hypothetical protein ACOYM2_06990 [Rectinemataceae bacterium]